MRKKIDNEKLYLHLSRNFSFFESVCKLVKLAMNVIGTVQRIIRQAMNKYETAWRRHLRRNETERKDLA